VAAAHLRPHPDPHDLAAAYEQLLAVERGWRDVKGALRLRPRGTAGGQKGLRSVIQHLGTTEFPRLRVGIRGERYSRERDLADYVLEPMPKAEREIFGDSVARVADVLRLWLTQGIDAAMRRANVQPSSPDEVVPD